MTVTLEVSVDDGVDTEGMPETSVLESAARGAASAAGYAQGGEVSLSIVSAETIRSLNDDWREKDKPTNVLAFATEDVPGAVMPPDMPRHLGDIVICGDVVRDEAEAQNKPEEAHWMHLTVHGMLHLLGYDHMESEEAERMESLEREVLETFGINDPYL
ncbi:MAG: rRNA maturation RNase YbeY [Pseudomonadota bacterium]